MNRDSLKEILNIAVHAPSGDNAQPWGFKIEDNNISIFNVPGKDATLYNFKERGSYIAHGALIENIAIAASEHGYKIIVSLFPYQNDKNFTASVSLEKSNLVKDSLYEFIKSRTTNRKPYKSELLDVKEKTEILSAQKEINFGNIKLIEDREKLNILGKLISLNERLILENRSIHDFLFGIIRWTEKEEYEKAGLYIKTFELPAPGRLMFALLRNWSFVKILNRFNFYKVFQAQTSKLYASSGAIGVITMESDAPNDFIMAGRVFQRLWLKVTKLNLSLQPITAIPYLSQRIASGDTSKLSRSQVDSILDADRKIRNIFGVSNAVIAMIFRVGRDGEPSARSFKFPPNIAI